METYTYVYSVFEVLLYCCWSLWTGSIKSFIVLVIVCPVQSAILFTTPPDTLCNVIHYSLSRLPLSSTLFAMLFTTPSPESHCLHCFEAIIQLVLALTFEPFIAEQTVCFRSVPWGPQPTTRPNHFSTSTLNQQPQPQPDYATFRDNLQIFSKFLKLFCYFLVFVEWMVSLF